MSAHQLGGDGQITGMRGRRARRDQAKSPVQRRQTSRQSEPKTPEPAQNPIRSIYDYNLPLTPTEGAQRKARAARDLVKGPPAGTIGNLYTPEHAKILEKNIKYLQNATIDPDPPTEDDESDNGSFYESTSHSSSTSSRGVYHSPATLDYGPKRQREEEPGVSHEVDAEEVTAESQKTMKRMKTVTQIGLPGPSPCLSELRPQPLQFAFPKHPDKDRSNVWYQNEFRKLFNRMDAFAEKYFGLHDLESEGSFYEPWASGMTPEFVNWVETVAKPDPGLGGWDILLRSTKQRRWLIVAILMRIIQEKVLNTDLWGADKEEKNLLFANERAFIGREGFQRTALRSQIVRTILGAEPLTKNFHYATARLTAQVALLFKPLTDFLSTIPPPKKVTLPTIEIQYQDLHNIIASAGYLSLCIRLSPTIFYCTEVLPGETYRPEDQFSTEPPLYSESKEVVTKKYQRAFKVWDDKLKDLEASQKPLAKEGDVLALAKLEESIEEHTNKRPLPPSRTHRALVKIGIWPNIRRFKPGGLEDDKKAEKLERRDGFRIHEITKSAVVCCFGIDNRAKRAETGVPLEQFVKQKERGFGTKKEVGISSLTYAGFALGAGCVIGYATCPLLLGSQLRGWECSGLILGWKKGKYGDFSGVIMGALSASP